MLRTCPGDIIIIHGFPDKRLTLNGDLKRLRGAFCIDHQSQEKEKCQMIKYYYSKPLLIYKSEFMSVSKYIELLSERYKNLGQENVLTLKSSIEMSMSELLECLRESGEVNSIIVGILPVKKSGEQTDPLYAFKTDKAFFLFSKCKDLVENYHGVDYCSEQVDLYK